MIKISGCADTVFEEAYFILKPAGHNGMTKSELVEEANRIISENSYSCDNGKKRYVKLSMGIFYTLLCLCFSGIAFSLIALLIFVN